MGITLGYTDRRKPGVDEGSGLILSSVSLEDTCVVNLEVAGHGYGDTMGSSEGTRVGNKPSIYDGRLLDIPFRAADRSKLGVKEGAELVSSDSSIEGDIDENLEVALYGTLYGIRQGTDSELLGITNRASYRSKFGRSKLERHWEQHWGKKLELIEVTLMGSQEGTVMEK